VSAKNLPGGRWQAFARDISEARRGAREREELLAREQLARRQAEIASQKLGESEERFRLTIDEAPIGMALVDLDGRFARVNAALCEIVGYTAHELERLRFQDITYPEDLDSDVAVVGRLIRGEIPRYQREKRYIRKDGSVVTILLNTSILRGLDGAPRYFISQIEDITERKRAGETERESERRLHLALESAQMGTWDLDLLSDTSVRSLRHDQIFGYASAIPTWGAARFMDHVVPEDRDVARRAFAITSASDGFELECRILPEPKRRAGETDGHCRGHQRAQARGGSAPEERTGVSVVGRIDAPDRLGHPAGRVEYLLQSAMGDLYRPHPGAELRGRLDQSLPP
jgi:PAS domain S-box-containing protein